MSKVSTHLFWRMEAIIHEMRVRGGRNLIFSCLRGRVLHVKGERDLSMERQSSVRLEDELCQMKESARPLR
jgi:hypothetical protein